MPISDIKNFRQVYDRLATGGQPTEAQLKDIASARYDVVINLGLLDPKYCLPDEAGQVASLGMEYHHVPVVFTAPQVSDFRRFVQIMDSCRARQTFVHCALNWRVSTFVGLFGELCLGWSRSKADAQIRAFWEPNDVWTSFIAECRARGVCASPMNPHLTFLIDDLSGEPTRALIARHLAGMYAASPPESVHAFDVDKLRGADVTFWSAWLGREIAGCGALKRLDPQRGELKSMRVADQFLGRGIGRALLNFLMGEARTMGMTSLWLETGSAPVFAPALRLYESAGFVRCGPFEAYIEDPFSVFMTRLI